MSKKILFNLTRFKLLLVRIISGLIANKQKRRSFRNALYIKYKKDYLKQYLYVLDNNSQIEKNKNKTNCSNKIWICWFQGEENAPNIVKICINSIREYKPKDMDIIILNNNNIKNYITFPTYILEKRNKGYIENAQYSDLLRIALLAKYGGIWIDSTVFLTSSIPENIIKANFFAFHSIERGQNNNSWFLVSKANNILINSIKKLMFEYWKNENKMLDYFLYHLLFDVMLENNKKLNKEWEKVPLYWDYDCYDIGKVMFSKYNDNQFKIFKKQPIHKLTYRYDTDMNLSGTYLGKILENGKNEKSS